MLVCFVPTPKSTQRFISKDFSYSVFRLVTVSKTSRVLLMTKLSQRYYKIIVEIENKLFQGRGLKVDGYFTEVEGW